MGIRGRVLGVFVLLLPLALPAADGDYQDTLAGWSSYEDVALWLEKNFVFDKERQRQISRRLKSQGPSGLLIRNPEKLFSDSRGFCGDAANFAYHALGEVDFEYEPSWVFIKNSVGRPNHWVTAFKHEGKTYIMDYGTGEKWKAMQGVHGPYDSLDEYRAFLDGLSMPGFGVAEVRYRRMPGTED